MKKLFLSTLFILTSAFAAFSQGTYVNYQAPAGPAAWAQNSLGAVYRVCAYSTSPAAPCTPGSIFSDRALGSSISQTGGVKIPQSGQITFFVAPGTYTVQYQLPSAAGSQFINDVVTAGADPSASQTFVSPVISTGLTASGSAANDFSGSTGAFKTSTGADTIGPGAVGISGLATFSAGILASGSVANDFSAGTGAFKTSTGANTFGGSSNTFTNAVTVSATTNQLALGTTNVTTLSFLSPAGSATIDVGTTVGSIAPAYSCGTAVACQAGAAVANLKTVFGSAPLTSGTPSTASITSLPFTSSSSYFCTASPNGTTAAIAAGGVAINQTSGSAMTLTGPNTVSTVISYICYGT